MSELAPFKYWAFISYSHHDRRWGAWLIRRLEAYRLPRALVGRSSPDGPLPRRLFPVFRDRDELASSSELGAEIERALKASRYLIVICSPHSAISRWVNEEIKYFKSLGREDRVLCLIVDGVPGSGDTQECFAPALRQRMNGDGTRSERPAEPIAADARAQGDGRERARLKLIAGLLGIGYDELRRRDLIARNRRLGALAIVATLTAALTVTLAIAAYVARQAAERSRLQAENLVSFMLGDLRAKLEPVGRLDVLDAVGEQAMQYFAQAQANGQTDATLAARAKALRQIGEIRVQQGRLADAAKSFAAALALDRDLAQRQPNTAQAIFNLGQSEYWAGYAAWLAGDFAGAQTHFLAYRETGRRLLALEPGKPDWLQELSYGESNLGTLAEARGELASALVHFEATRDLARDLAQRFPANTGYQLNLAESLAWIAAVQEKRGRIDEAQALLQEQADIEHALMLQSPQDVTLKYRYVLPLLILSRLQADAGRLENYAQRNAEAQRLSQELVHHDPDNLDWREALEQSHALASIGHEFNGQWQAALGEASIAMTLAAKCHRSDPDQARWRNLYVSAANRLADLQLTLNRQRDAAATLDGAAAAARGLADDTADDLKAIVDTQLLQLELAHHQATAATTKPPTLTPLLEKLDRLAPAAAASAQLRLAVIDHAVAADKAMPPSLPNCGLEYRRLLRFQRRNHAGNRLPDCAARNALAAR